MLLISEYLKDFRRCLQNRREFEILNRIKTIQATAKIVHFESGDLLLLNTEQRT